MFVQIAQRFAHDLGVRLAGGREFHVVVNAHTAAQVNVLQGNAVRFQRAHHRRNFGKRQPERFQIQQLGTDMHRNPHQADARHLGSFSVQFVRFLPRHAEFVFFGAGGDFDVRQRVHIRVDAQGHVGLFALRHGNAVNHFHFGGGLGIDLQNPQPHGFIQLGLGFAHSRKNDFIRRDARFYRHVHFPRGHHVRPAAQPRQRRHHAQVRVGFNGVAHRAVYIRQGGAVGFKIAGELVGGVAIKRRTHLPGNFFEVHPLRKQFSVLIMKTHIFLLICQ